MTPLISVAVPCYNSAGTLPLALASLMAQSYEDWECLLVDDGSTDTSHRIAAAVRDKRIKYLRLPQNLGRGAARQVALDAAKGDFLCMLDADDWLYPWKIERQVEVMQEEVRLGLVSTGMSIVNAEGDLVGARGTGPDAAQPRICGPVRKPCQPRVAFGPSMMRMSIAKEAKYDPTIRHSEDLDFLLKVLFDQYYCVLPDITYVYSEHVSATLEKVLAKLADRKEVFRKYRKHFPIASRLNICTAGGKALVYRCGFAAGLGRRLIEKRSREPTDEEMRSFTLARNLVYHQAERLFGNSACPVQETPAVARSHASGADSTVAGSSQSHLSTATLCQCREHVERPRTRAVCRQKRRWTARQRAGLRMDHLVKRLLDVTGALALLVLTSPALTLAALAVWLTMGPPVLFRQLRTGHRGHVFPLLKVRTMRQLTEEVSAQAADEARLTAVGRVLRALSLDELPQLWNVLRGDMSLVGPRPLLPEYLPRYTPAERRRHNVLPGITGLAQVNGRNLLSWQEKFALDCWYVDHRSLRLDLWILWRTLWGILRRDGITAAAHATMPEFLGTAQGSDAEADA